jgi:hypothetical protein
VVAPVPAVDGTMVVAPAVVVDDPGGAVLTALDGEPELPLPPLSPQADMATAETTTASSRAGRMLLC